MRVRVERDVLADAVAWAARGVPARPAVPVLAGLLLRAESGRLILRGFDYEVSAHIEMDAEVSESGQALVSGRLLADIARSLPNHQVAITQDGAKVTLTCGSTRFTLLTLPVEDYPALPEMPAASGWVPGATLAGAVAQVAPAASRDDTLPVLTGVRIEVDEETVTLVATDRYRLAIRELRWSPEQSGLQAAALVPARTLADTARALAGADKVTIGLAGGGVGDGLVGLEGEGRRTTTRLLDGEFPRYRSLLPSQFAGAATVETAPLLEAVRRVALVAERTTPIRLAFRGGELTLEAGTGDEASAAESLDAAFVGDDESLDIAFNPMFLSDGLTAVGTGWTRMSFTTPEKPAVLTGLAGPEAEAEEHYRYLLMPVRLSG